MKAPPRSFVQRLLITISKVVPQPERDAWLEEWHSEIWHWRKGRVASSRPPSTLALFLRALSAAPHALWVRRDSRRSGRTPHRGKPNVFGAFFGDVKYAVRRFDADNVLTVSFTFPDYAYDYGSRDFLRDYDRVLETVRQTPGVLSAGVVHQMPVVSENEGTGFTIPGVEPAEGEDRFSALFRAVSPGYFATMGIPLLAGRDVAESDQADAPRAIVINRTMAERFWPDKSPIGTWIDVWAGTAQIVGVVGDVRHGGFATEPQATIYISNTQLSRRRLVLMVRTATEPSHHAAAVREAIRQVVPEQPIRRIAPLTDVLSETVSASRLTTILLSSFAALALVLAAVGIYGVISYTVSQRTREMGIRMTLGALPSDVLRLVIRQGLTMTAIGTAGGLLVSVVLSRILSGMLFEVSGTDPVVLSSVTVGAIVVATLACYVPARRATRADPVQALRNE